MNRRGFFTMLGAGAALAYVPAALLSEPEPDSVVHFPNNKVLAATEWTWTESPSVMLVDPAYHSEIIKLLDKRWKEEARSMANALTYGVYS